MQRFTLYLHIPFCATRCSYCNFVTRDDSAHLMDDYVRALAKEIGIAAGYHGTGDAVCMSVYFGGGTPSLLSNGHLESILQSVNDTIRLSGDAEITLEANPQDIDDNRLHSFRALGINRLSIGCQSFHDDILQFLSRRHSADEARRAVRLAREAGFDNLSIDLMFNIPGQSREMWERDVTEALGLSPEHVSLYSLSIEPGTPMRTRLAKGEFTLPDEETSAELFMLTDDMFVSAGYRHYEVSNFAKPGFHSRHNSSYWDGTPYIGAGLGAHSYSAGVRSWNVRTFPEYIEQVEGGRLPRRSSETLTSEEIFTETVMLSLRTEKGLELARLDDSGRERVLRNMRDILQGGQEQVLVIEDGVLRIPPRHWVLADEIIARMVR